MQEVTRMICQRAAKFRASQVVPVQMVDLSDRFLVTE